MSNDPLFFIVCMAVSGGIGAGFAFYYKEKLRVLRLIMKDVLADANEYKDRADSEKEQAIREYRKAAASQSRKQTADLRRFTEDRRKVLMAAVRSAYLWCRKNGAPMDFLYDLESAYNGSPVEFLDESPAEGVMRASDQAAGLLKKSLENYTASAGSATIQ